MEKRIRSSHPGYVVKGVVLDMSEVSVGLHLDGPREMWPSTQAIESLRNVSLVFLPARISPEWFDEEGRLRRHLFTNAEAEELIGWLARHCDYVGQVTKEIVFPTPPLPKHAAIWWLDLSFLPETYFELDFDALGVVDLPVRFASNSDKSQARSINRSV